jgi:hypothetical protein
MAIGIAAELLVFCVIVVCFGAAVARSNVGFRGGMKHELFELRCKEVCSKFRELFGIRIQKREQ